VTQEDARIDADPTVRQVAAGLGVIQTAGLKSAITAASVVRVDGWISELDLNPQTLDEVQQLILNRTGLKVIRVQNDAELATASKSIRTANPALPEQLKFEFQRNTEAVVVKRSDADPKSCSRFIAIIDARPERQSRAWFAERHEPSHLLIDDPGVETVWRRTKVKRPEPIERVVDAVASAIGFWKPIVAPSLDAALKIRRHTLEAFDDVRMTLAPDASKQAAYRAFLELVNKPMLVLWSDYDSRAEDRAAGGDPTRSWALRARAVLSNSAARQRGISIWPNFRIPLHSVIRTSALSRLGEVRTQIDDLRNWESESSGPLPACRVRVTAWGAWATVEPF
jgi:hypothetical protein